jgi:hypothetical protein
MSDRAIARAVRRFGGGVRDSAELCSGLVPMRRRAGHAMTERKPLGLSWESWIDRRIREANRTGISGPPVVLRPLDVERVVEERLRQCHGS